MSRKTKIANIRKTPDNQHGLDKLLENSYTIPCGCGEWFSYEVVDDKFNGDIKVICPHCKEKVDSKIELYFQEPEKSLLRCQQ